MSAETLTIAGLGQRGEGIATGRNGTVFVPYALPGDTVLAEVEGDKGLTVDLLRPRVDRIEPICPYFGTCGGCAVQALSPAPYGEWKRGLVVQALNNAGIAAVVAPLLDAHGIGRRRISVHARSQSSPNVLAHPRQRVGFMRARTHEVIDIDRCPILDPALDGALEASRVLANIAQPLGKPLDLAVTATAAGLDVDMRGLGALQDSTVRAFAAAAARLDLARLANHGEVLLERRIPRVRFGSVDVVLPPGGFLQATGLGEDVLSALVTDAVGPARKVADLFCGLGTFTLRMAERATLLAVDLEGPTLDALSRAARGTPALRPVRVEARDLFRRPLAASELDGFDAVVFDPPRAGAPAQVEALAGSKVPVVVAVSCNPQTFARDAAILMAGGYGMGTVTPVDQFRYSPHVEMVAAFRRPKVRKPRTLFG